MVMIFFSPTIKCQQKLKNLCINFNYWQESEIAVAFLPILSDTRDYLKYSVTTLDEGEWVMLMKRPIISATGTGLLAPFTLNVWILILVSLLVVGPLIYCIIILRFKITGDTEQRMYALPHCMWFVYGALLKQGSTLSPIAGKKIKQFFPKFHK